MEDRGGRREWEEGQLRRALLCWGLIQSHTRVCDKTTVHPLPPREGLVSLCLAWEPKQLSSSLSLGWKSAGRHRDLLH